MDGSTSVSEIVYALCDRLKISKPDEFSLKRKSDSRGTWLAQTRSLDEQGVNENEELLFRKKYFSFDKYIDTTNPVQLHLIYTQFLETIRSGDLPCEEKEAIRLAALQLQVNFGDSGIIHKESLSTYLPAKYVKSKNIEKKITEMHKSFEGTHQLTAKFNYVQYCQSLRHYGTTFFTSTEHMGKKEREVVVGIKRDRILIFDPGLDNILHDHLYSELKRYASDKEKVVLDYGEYLQKSIVLVTDEAEMIGDLIGGYIHLLIQRNDERVFSDLGFEINQSDWRLLSDLKSYQHPFISSEENHFLISDLSGYRGLEFFKQVTTTMQVIMENMKYQNNSLYEDGSIMEILFDSKNRWQILNCEMVRSLRNLNAQLDIQMLDDNLHYLIKLLMDIAVINSSIYGATKFKDPDSKQLHRHASKINESFVKMVEVLCKIVENKSNSKSTRIKKQILKMERSFTSLRQFIKLRLVDHTLERALYGSLELMRGYIDVFKSNLSINEMNQKAHFEITNEIIKTKAHIQELQTLISKQIRFLASKDVTILFMRMTDEIQTSLATMMGLVKDTSAYTFVQIIDVILKNFTSVASYLVDENRMTIEEEIIVLSIDVERVLNKILDPTNNTHIASNVLTLLANLEQFNKLKNDVDPYEDKSTQFSKAYNAILNSMTRLRKLSERIEMEESVYYDIITECSLVKNSVAQIVFSFGRKHLHKAVVNALISSLVHLNDILVSTLTNSSKISKALQINLKVDEMATKEKFINLLASIRDNNVQKTMDSMVEFIHFLDCLSSSIKCALVSLYEKENFILKSSLDSLDNGLEMLRSFMVYMESLEYYIKSNATIDCLDHLKLDLRNLSASHGEIEEDEYTVREAFIQDTFHMIDDVDVICEFILYRGLDELVPIEHIVELSQRLYNMITSWIKIHPKDCTILIEIGIQVLEHLKRSIKSFGKMKTTQNKSHSTRKIVYNLANLIQSLYQLGRVACEKSFSGISLAKNLSIVTRCSSLIFKTNEKYYRNIPANTTSELENQLDVILSMCEWLKSCVNTGDVEKIGRTALKFPWIVADISYSLSQLSGTFYNIYTEGDYIVDHASKFLYNISTKSSNTSESNELLIHSIKRIKSMLYTKETNIDDVRRTSKMISLLSYDVLYLNNTRQMKDDSLKVLECCSNLHRIISTFLTDADGKYSITTLTLYLHLKDMADMIVSRVKSNRIMVIFYEIRRIFDSLKITTRSQTKELLASKNQLISLLASFEKLVVQYPTEPKVDMESKWIDLSRELNHLYALIDQILERTPGPDSHLSPDEVEKIDLENLKVIRVIYQSAESLGLGIENYLFYCIPSYSLFRISYESLIDIIHVIPSILNSSNDKLDTDSLKRNLDFAFSRILSVEKKLLSLNKGALMDIQNKTSILNSLDMLRILSDAGLLYTRPESEEYFSEIIGSWIEYVNRMGRLSFPHRDFLDQFLDQLENVLSRINKAEVVLEVLHLAGGAIGIVLETSKQEKNDAYVDLSELEDTLNTLKRTIEDYFENFDPEDSDVFEMEEIQEDASDPLEDPRKAKVDELAQVSGRIKSVISSFLDGCKNLPGTSIQEGEERNEISSQWSQKTEEINLMATISRLEKELEISKRELSNMSETQSIVS